MMGPTLLLMVGLVDLAGCVRFGRSLIGPLLFLTALSVLVTTGFGIGPAAALACAALAFGWKLAMSPLSMAISFCPRAAS
ncbi:hypothetical protein BMF89_08505 [Arthrobacter sp. SRS-W-1-2016]|nr:hypothetical protein BMF89_08505 [Arthrobacter sp. SRS-W-1-2016]